MEPSGQMDSNGYVKRQGGFSLCDAADEEVHFSREMPSSQGSYSIQIDHTNEPPIFLNANNFTDINLTAHKLDVENGERAKSSRILNTIGSKLRRGSNYLVAPKLVGQYLLGITIQSWYEFLNTSRMMKAPTNTHQLTRRLFTNLNYFQGNYLCVSLILIVYCILTSPLLLLAIICYLLALYVITSRSATGKHLRIASFRPNLQQQYSFVTLISIPLLWVAGAPSAVFWVIGASFVVVGLHASMYNNDRILSLTEISETNQPTVGQHKVLPSAHYYNHYPIAHQYLSIPSGVPKETNSSSYANTLSQWMTFSVGSSKHNSTTTASHKVIPDANTLGQQAPANSQQRRSPDVMIISQDYAGLGRVYEV